MSEQDSVKLPKPPIPKDAHLHNYPWMKFDVERLLDSDFWRSTRKRPDVRGAALAFWAAAWRETPVASLPDNVLVLADHAGIDLPDRFYGMTLAQAKALVGSGSVDRQETDRIATIDRSLHRFKLHSDGRWYHEFLVDLALKILGTKAKQQASASKTNANRWGDSENGETGKRRKTDKRATRDRQETDRYSDRSIPPDLRSENREKEESPLTPASGGTGEGASLRSEGAIRDDLGDRPSPHREASASRRAKDIDPEATAARQQVYGDAVLKDLGYTLESLHDALWSACADHESRLDKGSHSLKVVGPILQLVKDIPGLSIREDVLPAIRTKIARYQGDRIASWAFFASAIRSRHEDRIAGRVDGTQGAKPVYDPENPKWLSYNDRDNGLPPIGHPWQKLVYDDRTKELRCYGQPGRRDWEWYDKVKRYMDTGGRGEAPGQGGEWPKWFAAEEPGQVNSSCPNEILRHFGLTSLVWRPIYNPIPMPSTVVPIRPRESRSEDQPGAKPNAPLPETTRLAMAMGGLPNGSGSHAGPAPDIDDDPPQF